MFRKIFLFAALFIVGSVSAAEQPTITGRVTCSGKGVEGAVVSDGAQVVITDRLGRYEIVSDKKYGLVWISIPSGYEVERSAEDAKFYAHLSGEGMETVDFELKRVRNNRFTLFAFTDTHVVNYLEYDDINKFRTVFYDDITAQIRQTHGESYSVCLGDMTTDGKWYVTGFRLPQWDSLMKEFPAPLYCIMGNHDNDKKGEKIKRDCDWDFEASKLYRSTFGPQYYSLNIGKFHFVMLDNIIPVRPFERKDGKITSSWIYTITDEQFDWLAKDLALVPKSTPLVVCVHAPVFTFDSEGNAVPFMVGGASERLVEMVKAFRSVDILSGHTHANNNITIARNIREHNQTSVSGVSWFFTSPQTRLMSADGTHGGYQIYTFRGKKLSWLYKINRTPAEESQFMVFDMNTVPEEFGGKPYTNRVLIDVFNWCDGSALTVKEDGRKLEVRKAALASPLYRLVRKPELPKRPTAFTPEVSSHMFEVVTQTPNKTLKVTFTDPFGRKFSQTVVRPKEFRWDMK
jgi:3',5'-cyclic AMP phosphodiesterase CpdA